MAANQYQPGFPADVDPKIRRIVQDLFDRVNFLLRELEALKSKIDSSSGKFEAQSKQLAVSIQAAQDALTTAQTFVGFGTTVASAMNVTLTANGVGFQITGPSNGATISVTSASTARTAINAAQKESPTPGTITLAKITGGGVNGSLTISADGVISAYVAPT